MTDETRASENSINTPAGVQHQAHTATSQPSQVWLLVFVFLLALGFVSAWIAPSQNAVQQFYFRIMMGIAVAGIASIIPGFIEIRFLWLRNSIRAGGAIAVFVLIYFMNPATLNDSFRPTINLTGEWNFFLQAVDQEIPGGVASITHKDGENGFLIDGNVSVNPSAPKGVYNTPMLTFESEFSVITNRRIIFHYKTNEGEEGVAVAAYSGSSANKLLFSFRDFSGTDDDGFPSGIMVFRRVNVEAD